MKKMIILGAFLASSAAFAQAPTSGGTTNEAAQDPNETICRIVAETGSRLSRVRVCRTRAQWAESRRTTREDVERAQTQRVERRTY